MTAMELTLPAINLAAVVCLWASLVWLTVKRKTDISEEARKLFFQPLLFGLTFWSIERVIVIIPLFYAYYAKDTVEGTVYKTCALLGLVASVPSDVARFLAGRNLFRLQHRLLHDVQPIISDSPVWLSLKAAICSRAALIIAFVLAIVPVVLCSLWIANPRFPEVLVNLIAYGSAGYSFLVLGTGLTRELTRHRREFVGLYTGLSVVFYGVIQFLVPIKAWTPYLYVLAFALKAMFGVAIASFWTMSREVTRANEERPTVTVFKTRFLMEIHDALQAPDAISKFSDTAMTFLTMGKLEEVSRYIGSIKDVARRQNDQLREILQSLRAGAEVQPKGLLAAVKKLAETFHNGPAIVLQATGNESGLTPVQKENFYLVTREALRNAVRHADHATLITIVLDCDRKTLTIEDNGSGPWQQAELGRGDGISIMRACALEIGADLDIEEGQPHGIRVRLEMPSE